MNSAIFYNIHKSYKENFQKLPPGLTKLKKTNFKIKKPLCKFLGFPINIPFGIPAGPLLNSKYVKKSFELGFAVSTYKTVRSNSFPCHPYPNILFVKTRKNFKTEKNPKAIASKSKIHYPNITITNSFGVPSRHPKFWQEDVEKALKNEKEGNLLILSFMGTVKEGQTQQQLIDDFAKTAKLAKETGVKVLEVNLSCPNIGNEGLICYNLKVSEKVCFAIRSAIGKTPLIIKIGYYKKDKDIERIAKIANKYADAIAAINTIQAEIIDKNGNQALPGHNRLRSGVCGSSIRTAGLEIVSRLNKIKKKNDYKYEIIGIGGVMTPKDYLEYRKAGADIVQSATGAMWNPYLAYEIWKEI